MLQPTKVRNLISFGKRKQPDTAHTDKKIEKDPLNIRLQESCQFDLQKQFSQLGLEVVNSSEKSIESSCHFNLNQSILLQKMKGFLANVRLKIFKLKQDVNNLRKTQEQLFYKFNINQIIEQLKKNKITLMREATNECFQSLLVSSSESEKLDYIKKMLQSTSISIQFKNQLPYNGSLLKQIQVLKSQNQIKNKQIELFKKQIQGLKNLEQKKHNYYVEKLKLKQLQWERRLNQILNDYKHITNNKLPQTKCNVFIKEKSPGPRSRFATETSQLSSKRIQRYDVGESYLQNHSAFYAVNNSKQKKSRKNSNNISQNNNSYLSNHPESQLQSIEGTKQLYEKLKLLQKRCKMPNDSSLAKAGEKIKILEENVRKQIQNMKKL